MACVCSMAPSPLGPSEGPAEEMRFPIGLAPLSQKTCLTNQPQIEMCVCRTIIEIMQYQAIISSRKATNLHSSKDCSVMHSNGCILDVQAQREREPFSSSCLASREYNKFYANACYSGWSKPNTLKANNCFCDDSHGNNRPRQLMATRSQLFAAQIRSLSYSKRGRGSNL